jgi:hypothetical protein
MIMSKAEAPITPPTMAAVFGLGEPPPADVWETSCEARGSADTLRALVAAKLEVVDGEIEWDRVVFAIDIH